MVRYLNPEAYQAAQGYLKKADECYRKLYSAMRQNSVYNFENAMDTGGVIEDFRQRVIANWRKLQQLQQEMACYLEEYQDAQARGSAALGREYMEQHVYGTFGTLAAASAVSYEAYKTYRFASASKSFSQDYNDLYSFMQTDFYKNAVGKAGLTEWSNYGLYLDSFASLFGGSTGAIQEYTDELLESALGSIVDGLPGVKEEATSFSGTFSALEDLLGLENLDGWAKQLKTVLESCAKAEVPWERVQAEPTFQSLMSLWPQEAREIYEGMLKRAYLLQTAGEKLGDVMDSIDLLDQGIDLINHWFSDYSVQVSYLDSMEEALLNAGFSHGPVHEKIQEMRETYTSSFQYTLEKLGDNLEGEIKKAVTQKVTGSIPLLKNVDFGLRVVSETSSLLFSDEVSAYKGLAGLMQYDQALTASYDQYVCMMNDGVATAADMAQADQVYELLKATKAKEYEYMMTLCEGKDRALFNQYHQKYYELTGKAFENHVISPDWKADP